MSLSEYFKRSVEDEIEFPPTYRGQNLKRIAFPIGGIGTGHVSLGGRGDLRSWEIRNRPDRGNDQFYSFPAIRAESPDGETVARVLEGPIQPPYRGQRVGSNESGGYMSGLPHMDENSFTGAHPFAYLDFDDQELPCSVALMAYNPTIPHDADRSGVPVAVFEYEITNPTDEPLDVSVAFSVNNSFNSQSAVNERADPAGATAIRMRDPQRPADHPEQGSICVGVLDPDGTAVAHWPGRTDQEMDWFDKPQTFWETFEREGTFEPVDRAEKSLRTTVDGDIYEDAFPATVCSRVKLPPEKSVTRTFVIAWRFPNRTPERCGWAASDACGDEVVGNYYAEQFDDAVHVLRRIRKDHESLRADSAAFVEAVIESSAPNPLKDAALQNTSTLCTNTCFREADGTFHGFEGSHDTEGCCFGDCTHVWNYEQTTPFLFPELSRTLRETEFSTNTDAEGRMSYRTLLPSEDRIGEVAADGQMGCVVKLYRDWKLTGDTKWMRSLWPAVRAAIEFAWIDGGWDADKDGLMEGIQFNTYDIEFFGPNPLCQLWYLGALKACERMALANGEEEFAATCREVRESGRRKTEERLFNGEYFQQDIVAPDFEAAAEGLVGDLSYRLQTHPWTQSRPDGPSNESDEGPDTVSPEEFQLKGGCLTDQILGQSVARISGLGDLVENDLVESALDSIYEHNFRPDLGEHNCFGRVYALNDEGGTVLCSYPRGARPPAPFPYYSEVWTGSEYALATAMLNNGFTEEATEIVAAARNRFDGERRNPWDEVECSHHYARAMAAWGPLVALSGFEFDMVEGWMRFDPRTDTAEFASVWSTGTAWGTFRRFRGDSGDLHVDVEVLGGDLGGVSVHADGVADENLRIRERDD
jgi:uncharacterized protein (DUF608 family)